MDFFGLTKPGRAWNEDSYYVCENFGFVLDGATCLNNQHISNSDTDAKWLSNIWRDYLIEALQDDKKSLIEIIKTGVTQIKEEFVKIANGKELEDFPSSTIAIYRIIGDEIEFYALGDSPIVVQIKTGYTFKISSSDIEFTDAMSISNIEEYAYQHNLDFATARKEAGNVVIINRDRKNRDGGYHILSDSVEAINFGITGKMKLSLMKKVFVCSDGYAQIFELFNKYSLSKFCDKINCEKDLEKVYNVLYKLQEKDKNCNKFHRTKVRDDSTCVGCIF